MKKVLIVVSLIVLVFGLMACDLLYGPGPGDTAKTTYSTEYYIISSQTHSYLSSNRPYAEDALAYVKAQTSSSRENSYSGDDIDDIQDYLEEIFAADDAAGFVEDIKEAGGIAIGTKDKIITTGLSVLQRNSLKLS
ncbi:MAG: hypothetical protein LBV20_01380 [Treponema sp.]|jgi:hypothetical protein|nr:hypothetical protein [Treponema sp.]